MKDFLNKIFTINIYIVLIAGLSFFGVYKYVEYRFDIVSRESAQANEKIAKLEKLLEGTESNVASVLQGEQAKSDSLLSQFDEVKDTVGELSKLSKTDPELLKKYSKVYFLNEHYVPVSLSDVGVDYISNKSKNYQVQTDALPFLEKMIEANKNNDMSLLVLSAYRSFQTQATLKSNYKITYGAGANKFSADQGYSEHQLGTAIDFTTQKTNGVLDGFEKTEEYQWLLGNAYKYGFVISYPKGNTYYKFEPWHWRFVGVKLATKLHEDKINFYDLDQRSIDNYLINLFD